jgi:peroxin-10
MTDTRQTQSSSSSGGGGVEESWQYPYAGAPDIVRAKQKDAHFQATLAERIADLLRRVYGARFLHAHAARARLAADLLYLSLTTLLGNRTLGEEYCDIVSVEARSGGDSSSGSSSSGGGGRLPALPRRAGYILTSVVLPYCLARLLPAFRRKLRRRLLAQLAAATSASASTKRLGGPAKPTPPTPAAAAAAAAVAVAPPGFDRASLARFLRIYLLTHLDSLTSPSAVYALHLAVFYFTGAYHQLGRRVWGLRYMFTRKLAPSEARAGYEVLGALLVLQMAVQAWLHVHDQVAAGFASAAADASLSSSQQQQQQPQQQQRDLLAGATEDEQVLLGDGFSGYSAADTARLGADQLAKLTHTPVPAKPRYDLSDPAVMRWVQGPQQRRCTLCLEPMKEPSVTTCGHMFCWACIESWCREKAECPLCRQTCLPQHILPVRT